MTEAISGTDVMPSVFQSRDFSLYCSATFLATLANQILSVVVGWQVYELTNTPLALGYVGLVQFLPMLAFTFVAGGFGGPS
jgi:hypothetical protein